MSGLVRFSRTCAFVIAIAGSAAMLGSCELAKNQLAFDRAGSISRQDYRDALSPPPAPEAAAVPVPDFQPVLSTPQELRLPSPLVTVSVNQTISLRDLLFELAEQAGVDIELDPQIHGTIIFTAKERPFDEVVERICKMAGLRYTFKQNVLRVELDRPFVKSYSVNYLNITRTGDSSINTSVTVGGGSSGGEGGGSSTGSSSGGSESSIESTYEGDVWKELDENIKHILTATDTDVMLATLSDPVSTPINPAPPPLPAVDPNNPSAPPPPPLPGSPAVSAMPAAVAPTLNVTPSSEPVMPNPPATYSVSRQTGMVTVFASERQQRQIETYLNEFRRRATTQVMIEAKILQVELTDEFVTGIDWGSFSLTGLSRLTPNFTAPTMTSPPAQAFTAILEPRDNLDITVQALNRFGTVRTLSSPRITALNNQPAVVNVAENLIYFEIENGTSSTSTSSGTTTTGGIQAEAKTLPLGVLLNVIPSANPDTGEIFLNVRPTISKFVKNVPDPTPGLLALTATNLGAVPPANNIPQMATQEMESLMRLQSGQTMVMGGLMEDKNNVVETGLPLASDLPILGHLFKGHGDTVQKSELVIFLTATIVPGGNADETDRKIYKTFSLDRHPARL